MTPQEIAKEIVDTYGIYGHRREIIRAIEECLLSYADQRLEEAASIADTYSDGCSDSCIVQIADDIRSIKSTNKKER